GRSGASLIVRAASLIVRGASLIVRAASLIVLGASLIVLGLRRSFSGFTDRSGFGDRIRTSSVSPRTNIVRRQNEGRQAPERRASAPRTRPVTPPNEGPSAQPASRHNPSTASPTPLPPPRHSVAMPRLRLRRFSA